MSRSLLARCLSLDIFTYSFLSCTLRVGDPPLKELGCPDHSRPFSLPPGSASGSRNENGSGSASHLQKGNVVEIRQLRTQRRQIYPDTLILHEAQGSIHVPLSRNGGMCFTGRCSGSLEPVVISDSNLASQCQTEYPPGAPKLLMSAETSVLVSSTTLSGRISRLAHSSPVTSSSISS